MFNRQPRALDDPSHRIGMNGIGPGDRNDSLAVGHRDVFTLMGYPKADFCESFDGSLMVYAR
jgi:hypothetical protein